MASQPSVYNEERNLLRLRAWEQRNQETSQAKELNPEKVPLFGEPYKTNKGDELSTRIQRMLGSYEDVNNPSPLAIESLPIPSYITFSQSDQNQPNADKPTRPPFQNQVHHMSTQSQKAPSTNRYTPQSTRTSTAPSPPHHGTSSTFSNLSLNHSQHQLKKSEAHSDLSEEMSSQSPDVKPPPFLRSTDQDSTDTKDSLDKHLLQGSTDHPSECSSGTVDVSTFSLKQSPKDLPLSQANKGNTLPSQTFPSLLSKQPSVVMTQKPTAYVRPMDGPDQVVSESPELKPSPEPYVPLPELINKSDLDKAKILPQFLEPTRINEALCVQDILKEMTRPLPPLLTAIRSPGTGEPSKSSFPAKEAERASSCPGQKNYESSPAHPSQLIQQSSSSSFEAAHSRGAESASSSDSESSSRSESDSESTVEEPPQHPPSDSVKVKAEPDAPAVVKVDWQLGNWITDAQSRAHASESRTHNPPPPTHTSKLSSVEVVDPGRESKPRLSSPRQAEFAIGLGKPQQFSESSQDGYSHKSPSRKISCTAYSSKPAKAGCAEAAVEVKCEEGMSTCFTDKPKVKTKTGHGKKSSGDAKRDSKRTSKHATLDKRKPDASLVPCGHCSSCGYPNPCCCCPPHGPPSSPARQVRITFSKPKSETVREKDAAQKRPQKTKGPLPPRSLPVKIDLSLLSRIPQTPGSRQETPADANGNGKRSVLVVEQDGDDCDTSTPHKLSKTSKKRIPQNVEVDDKSVPRKKLKLENKNTSSSPASVKLESTSNSTDDRERKKAKKKPPQKPLTPKDAKDSRSDKRSSVETQESRGEAKANGKDSRRHKRSGLKHGEQPSSEKMPPKSSFAVPSSSQPTREALTNRPLLRFDDRQYPVKHYIKEAKKLKHKADAESDKLSKAFNYLEAAMYFVESGIAMEKDPQISMSSYTMFAETVELLKFVLKLKNSVDPSAPPSEKDFLALCLKCQSLLHMAMFRHKHKTALKYSKTLTDHFSNSAHKTHDPSKVADTPSPMPGMPSPANTSTSSGPASNHSGSSLAADPVVGTVAVPKAIEKVTFTYVSITTLFLNAHDTWEQAAELAHRGSGMLSELDAVMGPLSLAANMSSMVRYTRQGVHWLRLDAQKVK